MSPDVLDIVKFWVAAVLGAVAAPILLIGAWQILMRCIDALLCRKE